MRVADRQGRPLLPRQAPQLIQLTHGIRGVHVVVEKHRPEKRGDSGAPSFIKSDRIRCRAAVNKEQPTLCQSLHERQHQLRIAGRSRSLVIIYPAHIRHGVQIRFYDA